MSVVPFINSLDITFLTQELAKSKYEPGLGVRKVDLGNTTLGNVPVSLILIQLDPGKELKPHLHETEGGEIWLPMTKGIVQFGKAQKELSGQYKTNEKQEIIADWENPIELTPFKALEAPIGIPHYLLALSLPLIVACFLPVSHPTTDIKLTTHPK